MAKDAVTGAHPTRPVPYDPNTPMNAEREAMQRYDGALSKAVAIVAATAGDNYFTICNPFIDTSSGKHHRVPRNL